MALNSTQETKLEVRCMHCNKHLYDKEGNGTSGISTSVCKDCMKKHHPDFYKSKYGEDKMDENKINEEATNQPQVFDIEKDKDKVPFNASLMAKVMAEPNKWVKTHQYEFALYEPDTKKLTIKKSVGTPIEGVIKETISLLNKEDIKKVNNILKEEIYVSTVSDKVLTKKIQDIENDFLDELMKLSEKEPQIKPWYRMYNTSFKTIPDLIRALRRDNIIVRNDEVNEKLGGMITKYHDAIKTLAESVQHVNKKRLVKEDKELIIEQLYNVIKDRSIVYGRKDGKKIIGIHYKVGDKSLFEIFDLESARADGRNIGYMVFDPLPEGYKFKYPLALGEEKVKGADFVIYPTKFERMSEDGSIVVRTVLDRKVPQFTVSNNRYNEIVKSVNLMKEMRIIVERDEPPFVNAAEIEKGKEASPPEMPAKKGRGRPPGSGKKQPEIKQVGKNIYEIKEVPYGVDALKAEEKQAIKDAGAPDELLKPTKDMSISEVEKELKTLKKLSPTEVKAVFADDKAFEKFIILFFSLRAYINSVSELNKEITKKGSVIGDTIMEKLSSEAVAEGKEIEGYIKKVDDVFVKIATMKQDPGKKEVVDGIVKILQEQYPQAAEAINSYLKDIASCGKTIRYIGSGVDKKASVASESIIKEGVLDNIKNKFKELSSELKEKITGIFSKKIENTTNKFKKLSSQLDSILNSNVNEGKLNEKDSKVIDTDEETETDDVKPVEVDPTKEKKIKKGNAQVVDTDKSQIPEPQPEVGMQVGNAQSNVPPAPLEAPPAQPQPQANTQPPPEAKEPVKDEKKDDGEKKEKKPSKTKYHVLVQMDDKGKFEGIAGVESNPFDAREKKKELEDDKKIIKMFTVNENLSMKRILNSLKRILK